MAILKIYQDTRGRGACRSCGASVEWAQLTSGKRHPFNGEIVAVGTSADLDGRVIEAVDTTISPSHFQTCPQASDWRRR